MSTCDVTESRYFLSSTAHRTIRLNRTAHKRRTIRRHRVLVSNHGRRQVRESIDRSLSNAIILLTAISREPDQCLQATTRPFYYPAVPRKLISELLMRMSFAGRFRVVGGVVVAQQRRNTDIVEERT
ncbi:hypothetical protein LSAT2_012822 [Lamellibrachia satsuma]|nr:hypothetical protein LSAT2_012822 [Lamellibrachia satsuma]